jgi:hypothetical protein
MLFYFADQLGMLLSTLAFLPIFDRFLKWVSVYIVRVIIINWSALKWVFLIA